MQLIPSFAWRTSRIELFELRPENVNDAYVAWLADADVNRFLESRFFEHTLESTREFVAKASSDLNTLMLGITSLELGRHVGNIKLGPIDRRHGLGEIGIMIGDRAAWGRGIGSDAIELMYRIAIEELRLRKITAGCYASNVGSLHAFLKASFRIEAVRPNHFLLDGRGEDLVLLARHRMIST